MSSKKYWHRYSVSAIIIIDENVGNKLTLSLNIK